MTQDRRALYPGSFDPFTNGHLDVLGRALEIFDAVTVAIAANPEKRQPLFSVAERVEMIGEAVAELPGASVTSYTGLTVDFARAQGMRALVRGLRAYSDFDGELQQALMNRKLAPEIHTVFLMSSEAHIFVSSSILKDVASYGRDLDEFVPPPVARRLKEKFY
ncbi:MAG TPA: pantetheine-phosphate adenylyltransferase [Candidatus Binatia bacterium]|nr:pantetheine-phosphate adenylyltransferase [Candidatus Binatia bacterium]